MRFPILLLLMGSRQGALLLAALIFTVPSATLGQEIDFAREVLPILSNKCFVCHGPDTKKKNRLRLDSYEHATADRDGYHAIDPKDPAESEMLVRLHDKEDPMPPEDAEKQLSDAERKILIQWVKEGGTYARHWAFVP